MGQHNQQPYSRPLPIDADWDPAREARFFLRLVSLQEISVDEAHADILMSKEQLAWLAAEFPEEADLIKRIYERRVETDETFQRLLLRGEPS